ncbi:AIPR family protein [Bacteroides fragilis]|uniref:AIPR family protein n=1 Tax=Bacteroides fragilis TaxID=817 RepID=UPI0037037AE9
MVPNYSVNSCIAITLKNKNAEDFWWLNNGITILSDKITPITSKQLSIDNPEIDNGLQCRCLYILIKSLLFLFNLSLLSLHEHSKYQGLCLLQALL